MELRQRRLEFGAGSPEGGPRSRRRANSRVDTLYIPAWLEMLGVAEQILDHRRSAPRSACGSSRRGRRT